MSFACLGRMFSASQINIYRGLDLDLRQAGVAWIADPDDNPIELVQRVG
jgi:hypothetical protein